MPKGKDININLGKLTILVYGSSGARKTPGAASFPSPYFFDTDQGLNSIRGQDFMYDTYTDPDPYKASGWNRVMTQVDKFIKSPIYKDEDGTETEIKTVVFDGAWTLSRLLYNEVMKVSGRAGKAPEIQDHMMVALKFEEFLSSKVLSLPMTVIMITQEELIKNEESGRLHGVPLLPGQKLPFKAPLYFDEIYRAIAEWDKKDEKMKYEIMTRPDRTWTARSRLGIEHPSEFMYDVILKQASKMPHVYAKGKK